MKKYMVRIVSLWIFVFMIFSSFPIVVLAASEKTEVAGKVYEFDKNSSYEFQEDSLFSKTSTDNTYGKFHISGNISAVSERSGIPTYEVADGNLKLFYNHGDTMLSADEDSWHLGNDKSKKVNGLTLKENILSGALILQTSLDGINWTEDVLLSDVFVEGSDESSFYETKDIQLQNGCYYRVLIAYKLERQLEDSKILFVTTHNYEYKKVAEVYEFYVFCQTGTTSPDATPMKKLGSKINTGKDNGYSGNKTIDKNDPHYGWDIGYFYINGYTRETATFDKVPVFLKNVGDKVTLWFHLSEDITKLRDNKHMTINEDTNGYDRIFEIDQTNFKRGTLIIRYTDSHGNTQVLPPYTDYLAANARTGANTKVQLFEEGDYTVSLNYEVKSMGGPLNTIATYTNYKIMFEFSIRNGNCMVYPFDSLTGAELADNALTENGFKLDMAKSKYLNIDVQRSILVVGTDGYLNEDIRFNRPAKDGEVYTSDGIYTFKVSNLYTGEKTTKTVYVGSSSYLRALSATGMSVAELTVEIEKGAIIHEDGTVEVITTAIEIAPEKTQETTELEVTPLATGEKNTSEPEEEADDVVLTDTQEESQRMNYIPIVVGGIAAVIIVYVVVIALKHKKPVIINEEETE